jgi:hypothetical protein
MKPQNFDEKEWKFEDSSGYAGARNIHTNEWIYANDYWKMKFNKESYDEWQKLIEDFKSSSYEDLINHLIANYHAPKKLY